MSDVGHHDEIVVRARRAQPHDRRPEVLPAWSYGGFACVQQPLDVGPLVGDDVCLASRPYDASPSQPPARGQPLTRLR